MPKLKRSRTYRINTWGEWEALCYKWGYDPLAQREITHGVNGGDTITYKYLGEYPRSER